MAVRQANNGKSEREKCQGQYRPRVIVKFRDHIGLPCDKTAANEIEKLGLGSWKRLEEQFKGITLSPLFASKKPEEIQELIDRGVQIDPTYRPPDFLTYFAINIPAGVEAQEVAKALSRWESVQTSYVEPPPIEPPVVNPTDDPRSTNQGYLDPAPDGIDAEYAWGFAGGAAAGQGLVDLERGWTFSHEDLIAHGITLISGINHSWFFHGTGVLGEVAAVDNTVGCVGITPEIASIRCVGQWLSGGGYSTSQPILDAIAVMNFGDVLLLEAQTSLYGYSNVPVEIEPAVFDVIRLATALGIVVVQAAGNGGVDLDTVVNPGGEQIFNRGSTDFRDSGAIIVGAGSSTAPHTRLGFSCFGSRIDCYGWGENVDTLSTDGAGTATNLYTTTFGGTSSASPIVAGAALVVQGLAEAIPLAKFAPWQLRAILSDPANGTPSQNPAMDRIGVMPNLRSIIDGNILNLAPDVYLRDFVGDTGDPHTGAISASPDVILQKTAVADPQASFGEGSGTENSSTQGSEAEAGQNNFVYVRVRNRGGSPAANVDATVYWSPPATLITPDLWTLVGSATLPNVLTGNLLTVSDAITWLSTEIPATGHYCFVALVGNAQDPAPTPADFLDFDKFRLFIRTNNNVTWRNFNVVNNVPPPGGSPPDFVSLPFIAAGAPDKARRMGFEVIGRLPREAKALLEMPGESAQLIQARSVSVKGVKNERTVYVPVNPSGRTKFEHVAFPAKARIPMRLLVNIPKELRKHEFEIFARQMYGEEEVGRVTWRLAAPKKHGDDRKYKR
jgi:hypothetical protein